MVGAGESRKETCSLRRSLASPKSNIKPAHVPLGSRKKVKSSCNTLALKIGSLSNDDGDDNDNATKQ